MIIGNVISNFETNSLPKVIFLDKKKLQSSIKTRMLDVFVITILHLLIN